MKRFHLVFGLVVLIVFLLTGQYMDRYHNHLEFMADGPRMLYRSRHIFILMAGLLQLGVGTYFESRLEDLPNYLTLPGTIMIAVGTLLHFFSGVRQRGP